MASVNPRRVNDKSLEGVSEELQQQLVQSVQPLSRSEYDVFKLLIGTIVAYGMALDNLKPRLKSIPGGWRDARMIYAVSTRLRNKLLLTIPYDKLRRMEAEIPHLSTYVGVNTILPVKEQEEWAVYKQGDVSTVVKMACENNCTLCDRRDGKVRGCPLRKAADKLLPFNVPSLMQDGSCLYQQYDTGLANDLEGAQWLKDMRGLPYDED